MSYLLMLFVLLAATPFESKIEQAFAGMHNNDWTSAAAALDGAYAEQPAMFAANNFHYLRGRIAENQGDWQRARDEFKKTAGNNPLYPVAIWHAARSSAKLREDASTMELISLLPSNFPRELKLTIARESGPDVALKIYQDTGTREARYGRARALSDN